MEDILNQIKEKIKYEIDDNDCWNVISGAYKEKQGYNVFSLKISKRKYTRARLHRLIYIAVNGEIPPGKIVCHKCDNKGCINPNHLFLGTKKQNTQDMIKKGRASDWKDRNGKRQKLTNNQIIEIYESNKSSYGLSLVYNVSDVQIRRIKNGSRCANVTKHK